MNVAVDSAPGRSIKASDFVNHRDPVMNAIAVAYALMGYLAGLWGLLQPEIWIKGASFVLLTHALVVSAYLSHECMHGTIFAGRRGNMRLGTLMLWLNGGCYCRFDDLAVYHVAHHVERSDFGDLSMAQVLTASPKWVRWAVLGLEWLYLPVISFWIQWRRVLKNWRQPDQRLRVLLLLLLRGGLFVLLGWISPVALLLYFLAYVSMTNILRWMDAFQHTYEVFRFGTELPVRSLAYERENTFSTLLSVQHRWLNLLLLNFGYHNAHHELMKCPWHSLPALDRRLFSEREVHYLPLSQLIGSYHRYRIHRIFSGQGQATDAQRQPTPEQFYGAVGVSFLTIA